MMTPSEFDELVWSTFRRCLLVLGLLVALLVVISPRFAMWMGAL
jgi:hypothetical protein